MERCRTEDYRVEGCAMKRYKMERCTCRLEECRMEGCRMEKSTCRLEGCRMEGCSIKVSPPSPPQFYFFIQQ